jgi:hypothetical protein
MRLANLPAYQQKRMKSDCRLSPISEKSVEIAYKEVTFAISGTLNSD